MEKKSVRHPTDEEHAAITLLNKSEAGEFFFSLDDRVTMVTTFPAPTKSKNDEPISNDDIASAYYCNVLLSVIRIKNVQKYDAKTVLSEVMRRLMLDFDVINGISASVQKEKRESPETLN